MSTTFTCTGLRSEGAECAEQECQGTFTYCHVKITVRRERRVFLVGANPTQQLSLRLVAARAVHGGNDMG